MIAKNYKEGRGETTRGNYIEALPGWSTCSLVPLKTWPCFFVPPKQNLDYLCSLFPNIACVPMFHLFLGLCSPEKLPLFPCSPKPLGEPLYWGETTRVGGGGEGRNDHRLKQRRYDWWGDGLGTKRLVTYGIPTLHKDNHTQNDEY